MNYSQKEFVKIGAEHFHDVILPRLRQISKEVVDDIIVFIEGSVSYGFCDQYSDIDIDFHINRKINNELSQEIIKIFNCETYWHKSIRVSYGFGGDYWKLHLVLKDEMDQFWNEFNPYALNNITHAIPIYDPKSLMPVLQKKVSFYPAAILKNVLRGLWITINDSGNYNVSESIKRGSNIEGKIYLFRAIEALMRIIYLLNNQYYPPTKWLSTGLKYLSNDFGIKTTIEQITTENEISKNWSIFMISYDMVKSYLHKTNAIEEDCLENYGATFQKKFFIFNTF